MGNFLEAMYQANLLYGISFTDTSEFEEIGLIAWESIGNKRTRLYKYIGHPNQDGIIELPCNCDVIEAVVAPHEDWNYTSNKSNVGDIKSEWIEEWIEHFKFERNPYYASGHYVHFKELGNKQIQLLEPTPVVLIIYKGIELDEDDLPILTQKEIKAIATYVAYVKTFKEATKTMNGNMMQVADRLQRLWYSQIDNARTPEAQLTQNDFDNIANAKSRWPGKVYGKSYKPLLK